MVRSNYMKRKRECVDCGWKGYPDSLRCPVCEGRLKNLKEPGKSRKTTGIGKILGMENLRPIHLITMLPIAIFLIIMITGIILVLPSIGEKRVEDNKVAYDEGEYEIGAKAFFDNDSGCMEVISIEARTDENFTIALKFNVDEGGKVIRAKGDFLVVLNKRNIRIDSMKNDAGESVEEIVLKKYEDTYVYLDMYLDFSTRENNEVKFVLLPNEAFTENRSIIVNVRKDEIKQN